MERISVEKEEKEMRLEGSFRRRRGGIDKKEEESNDDLIAIKENVFDRFLFSPSAR